MGQVARPVCRNCADIRVQLRPFGSTVVRSKTDRAEAIESLAEIRALRAGNLRLIRSLGPAERTRVGVHTERGEESVEHLVRMYAGHDLLHLNQLERIRTTLGMPTPA